jgi:hypothetical protein
MTVYPAVMVFLNTMLTHTTTTTTTTTTHGGGGGPMTNKFAALHPSLHVHLRQWGYCTYLAAQDEYYEAARTTTYMLLHGGRLPGWGGGRDDDDAWLPPLPPRRHGEILRELRGRLGEALAVYCDDEMVVMGDVPKERQPRGAGFFFEYPAIGMGHFEQQMRDASEGRVCHYSFADVFDGLGWDGEGEEGETSGWVEESGEGVGAQGRGSQGEGVLASVGEVGLEYEESHWRPAAGGQPGDYYFVSDDDEYESQPEDPAEVPWEPVSRHRGR